MFRGASWSFNSKSLFVPPGLAGNNPHLPSQFRITSIITEKFWASPEPVVPRLYIKSFPY